MTHDPEPSIAQVAEADEQFRKLVEYVESPATLSSTAYEVELSLFREVLALGRSLLKIFMNQKAAASGPPRQGADGATTPQHSWQTRTYVSVFGPIAVRRRYYRRSEGGGVCPVDAELSLGRRRYSDLLRSWLEYAVAGEAYDEAVGLIERILGLELSKRVAERLADDDSQDVDAFYDQKSAPPAAEEGSILVVQVDGKGVRMWNPPEVQGRRTQKKEAVITAVYTTEPHFRDPEEIADTLAGKPRDGSRCEKRRCRPEPVAKELRVTLKGKDRAFDCLERALDKRNGPHFRARVALTDGDPALQNRVVDRLADFTLILDIVHVASYVRSASAALLGENNPVLQDYVACRLDEVLAGQLDRVLAIFEDRQLCGRPLCQTDKKVVATTMGYLRRNASYLRYDEYLANGWPIASGAIEGAAGHLVKDRMERAGMKWRPAGAQSVLSLRTVRVNDDWDDYQRFRRHRQHRQLYGPGDLCPEAPEHCGLAPAA
ncbi:MAG: ISKra4 family transposase, partial [Candidatus Eisenbacteria bacterium]|nr:ISKra4 family transposase [Candidatus Eisenbacteria bacterium]